MDYLNQMIQSWMPSGKRVAVDSYPPLAGIFDTINSTLATQTPETRLPEGFYDAKGRQIIDRIAVEEEYSGYKESSEYRKLGIGALLGDIVQRMVARIDLTGTKSVIEGEASNRSFSSGHERERGWKFALSGCHDSTLAAILASLGAMEGENGTWPSYCSSLAVELFREANLERASDTSTDSTLTALLKRKEGDLWSLSSEDAMSSAGAPVDGLSVHRTPTSQLDDHQRRSMNGFYVRLRYNDRPVVIPGCKAPGNHLEGDESFCTLVSISPCPLCFDSVWNISADRVSYRRLLKAS